ncbi:MAG: hypothetical protein JWN73_2867 [Betaproteobacteria bacterium]|nr:hypothetical protein [Betaproteobacteria bacterium]
MSASSTEIFAVLGRIHVLLRRDLNRITDIEWASANKAYAMEVVRLCASANHPDLKALAIRLSELMELSPAVKPGSAAAVRNPAPAPMGPATEAAVAEVTGHAAPSGPRYIGGVR